MLPLSPIDHLNLWQQTLTRHVEDETRHYLRQEVREPEEDISFPINPYVLRPLSLPPLTPPLSRNSDLQVRFGNFHPPRGRMFSQGRAELHVLWFRRSDRITQLKSKVFFGGEGNIPRQEGCKTAIYIFRIPLGAVGHKNRP